mmetsp:Transcript_21353/g.39076  ORF Transcript_21353/g.39076 Transcript_21353/m.39076 type:complete len:227 (+) Transcript_21353:1603-2283(+)
MTHGNHQPVRQHEGFLHDLQYDFLHDVLDDLPNRQLLQARHIHSQSWWVVEEDLHDAKTWLLVNEGSEDARYNRGELQARYKDIARVDAEVLHSALELWAEDKLSTRCPLYIHINLQARLFALLLLVCMEPFQDWRLLARIKFHFKRLYLNFLVLLQLNIRTLKNLVSALLHHNLPDVGPHHSEHVVDPPQLIWSCARALFGKLLQILGCCRCKASQASRVSRGNP